MDFQEPKQTSTLEDKAPPFYGLAHNSLIGDTQSKQSLLTFQLSRRAEVNGAEIKIANEQDPSRFP